MADDSSEIVKEAAESVAFDNVKTIGGASSFYAAQMMNETLAQTQAMNQIRLAVVSKATDSILTTSAEEGVTPTALAEILSKIGGNTPPVTP